MKFRLWTSVVLILLASCAQAPAPRPPAEPAAPELRPELRIVSLPISDDLEELATFSRLGLPLDIFASITAGEEPLVTKVVSRATLISIARGSEGRSSSIMLAVPRDEVEMLVLTRDLVRRKQASFYLAAGPRNVTAPSDSREKSLQFHQMLSRLGYNLPDRRAPVTPAEPASPKTAPPAPAPPSSVAPPAPAPVAKSESVQPPEELRLPDQLSEGRILIDGSSTVFPMAKLVRDEFMRLYPGVRVELMGINPGESPSGSGGGFKKFCFGETDISDASRFMKDEEVRKCAGNNVSFLELPLAYDGLSVVLNRENTWVNQLTVAELRAIWAQDSKVRTWQDVRPDYPKQPIKLFAPGRDSGTFDYFNEAIFGKPQPQRVDVVASEDDEILVRGILSTPGAMGYFGLAYYIEHKDALKIVAIDGGKGPVLPNNETVLDGSYTPFSRPLFVYVNTRSLARPEVSAFVKYFLWESSRVAQAVGYIPLPDDLHRLSQERLRKGVAGSMRPLGQLAGTLRAMMAKP